MQSRKCFKIFPGLLALSLASSFAQAAVVDDVLKEYSAADGMNFSAKAGASM